MPELPEVETFKKYFDGTSLNQQIDKVEVSDDKIIRNLTGNEFIEKMTGRTFLDSYRRGKYLFGRMDNDEYLLFHFGMTGDLNYYDSDGDRTKHERFVFYFTNNQRLGFDCPRKFARIEHIVDLQEFIKGKNLGEDALVITEKEFLSIAEGKKSSIKGFLLNQKHLAGVGNLYADEVCFQTKINPASRVSNLSKKQLKAIFKSMQNILNEAIEKSQHYKHKTEGSPWDKWRKEGELKGKGTVVSGKIAGRTTYWVEGWQKLYE